MPSLRVLQASVARSVQSGLHAIPHNEQRPDDDDDDGDNGKRWRDGDDSDDSDGIGVMVMK